MEILLGTANPSKIKRLASMLDGYGCTFLTPGDLPISGEPEETGCTPEENARLKAAFHGQYAAYAVCQDSGLYLSCLSLDDPRQPGVHVRTPMGKSRLADEEMIAYYAGLIHSLGGTAEAYYLDAYAVSVCGQVVSFMDEGICRTRSFWMTDTPSPYRHPGWPLDSLSKFKNTGRYFVDEPGDSLSENPIAVEQYRQKTLEFLLQALGLKDSCKR